MDLSVVLGEYGHCSSHLVERETFFTTLGNNSEMQLAIFNAINGDDSRFKCENVSPLLKLLLTWFRSTDAAKQHAVLQFLPQLISLSLTQRRKDKSMIKDLDAFLLAVYNHEIADESGEPQEQSFQIQSITHSSIYHDGSRVDPTGLDHVDRDTNCLKLSQSMFKQAMAINAQNRMIIVEALFRTFNSVLGELSRPALDQFVRSTQRLLQRGFVKTGTNHQRVNLSANVLLELLHGVYFCIYNGFQSSATSLLDLIRQRGAAIGSSSVLLTVNSVRTLVLNSGPSQLPATSITTPSQIAKNLITNASFRAKKMGDDIPKVAVETASESSSAIANNLKVLANMSAISEEIVEEVIERTPTKGGNREAVKKEKLRPKIPGFKKRSSDSEKDQVKGDHRRQDKKKDASLSAITGEGLEMTKLAKSSEKKKDKVSKANSSAGEASIVPPTSLFNGMQVAASEIDTMEQIEALIQMKRLPTETVTIHSPESGTTIF